MKKPLIIIFEGQDKTGKTTLLNSFNSKTNFKYLVLDRCTISSKVYDKVFKRNRRKYYNNVEKKLLNSFNVLVVLCTCDKDVILKRLKEANEELPKELSDITYINSLFIKEASEGFKNVLEIDTTNGDIDTIVDKIIDEVFVVI